MARHRSRRRKHVRQLRRIFKRVVIIRRPIIKRVVIIRRPIKRIIVKRPIRRIIVKRIIRRTRIVVRRVAVPRLPRVTIVYNDVYDEAIHSLVEKKHTHLAHLGGQLFARRLRKSTKSMLKRFLVTAENVTGLHWKWALIRCYVVHDIQFDFDDPMTVKIRRSMNDATETFFHELTHQLELQNKNRIHMRNYIHKKYNKESKDTRDHILAHAILWKVYEKLYGKKKLKRIIAGYKLWPDHYRGWKIVKKEGPDRILKAYLK
jgi:hypothetical protein